MERDHQLLSDVLEKHQEKEESASEGKKKPATF